MTAASTDDMMGFWFILFMLILVGGFAYWALWTPDLVDATRRLPLSVRAGFILLVTMVFVAMIAKCMRN